VIRYEALARRFLTARVAPGDERGVERLGGAELSAYLVRECARVSLGSAKGRVAELRALLRFLHVRGLTRPALADALPSAAGWRETAIPQTITHAEVERLVAGCERSALDGLRDAAMLLLLARLGLRSIEVARLELDDLDWRRGELVVRGNKASVGDTAEGFVVSHQIYLGNPADAQTLKAAIAAAQDVGMRVRTVLADRGYGNETADQALARRGARPRHPARGMPRPA
jgi:integrase